MKKTFVSLFLIVCLHDAVAIAAPASPRYFEGEVTIEATEGVEGCQNFVGKSKRVQISFEKAKRPGYSGWLIIADSAPGQFSGQDLAQLEVHYNYFERHLNTPTVLELREEGGRLTGVLREKPARLGYQENFCFWKQARLNVQEKPGREQQRRALREHRALYQAFAPASEGQFHQRYHQDEQAVAAYERALTVLKGELPESHERVRELLVELVSAHARAGQYGLAAERNQRLIEAIRAAGSTAPDPALYWRTLLQATYLFKARHHQEALPVVEQARTMSVQVRNLELDDRLYILRLHGLILQALARHPEARIVFTEEAELVRAEKGGQDRRLAEARLKAILSGMYAKDRVRFRHEAQALLSEWLPQLGSRDALILDVYTSLGIEAKEAGEEEQARVWLEKAWRGHTAEGGGALEIAQRNPKAMETLVELLGVYERQQLIPSNYLQLMQRGEFRLEHLPILQPPL